MVGDLLIDHDDNVEEKSSPEHPRGEKSEAAATTQIVDLLVKSGLSYHIWFIMTILLVLYLADLVSFNSTRALMKLSQQHQKQMKPIPWH